MTVLRAAASAATAAAAAAGAYRLLRSSASPSRWERTNHAGRAVTLVEGPAWAAGAAAGALGAGPAGVVAVLGASGFGALDDHAGDSSSKGLRGHLRAAARGQVTTGAVKILGLGVTGLAVAALIDRERDIGPGIDTLVGGAVVAGSANLVNLLDLRPGRALKATVLAAAVLLARAGGEERSARCAAAAIGASLATLPEDLAGRAMLGDTGANAAGALVGTAYLAGAGPRGRLVALGVLTALTLASERVSFTRVIESTPGLRELDAWGRRGR